MDLINFVYAIQKLKQSYGAALWYFLFFIVDKQARNFIDKGTKNYTPTYTRCIRGVLKGYAIERDIQKTISSLH